MKQRIRKHNKIDGFTLVEVLVALVVTMVVTAAAYASYKVQQNNHKAQMQVTEIQQNLRAALNMISRDFRVVGYDPDYTDNYSITVANSTNFQFTGDLCEDTDHPNTPKPTAFPTTNCGASSPYSTLALEETYAYQFYDSDGDGNNDAIRRIAGGTAIAEQIERLDFRYILQNGVEMPSVTLQLDDIRAVKVSILARAREPDFNYTDTKTYPYGTGLFWNPSGFATASCGGFNCQNFRRRSLVVTIELRNMGI